MERHLDQLDFAALEGLSDGDLQRVANQQMTEICHSVSAFMHHMSTAIGALRTTQAILSRRLTTAMYAGLPDRPTLPGSYGQPAKPTVPLGPTRLHYSGGPTAVSVPRRTHP